MAAVAADETVEAPEARRAYRALAARRIAILTFLLICLMISVAADMALGPARYSLAQVISALLSPADVDVQLRVVIWDIRMPVALMAVTVGACLSLAGAEMQTILANPLASPFTLGISAAAGFGAALALVAGVAVFPAAVEYMIPINAFLMAIAASLFIYGVSTLRGVTVETIVLLGIALVFTFNALLSLLEYLASEQAAGRRGVLDHGLAHEGHLGKGGRHQRHPRGGGAAVRAQVLGADGAAARRRQGGLLRRQRAGAAAGDHAARLPLGGHPGCLRRHHRLHRSRRAAYRPHAGGRGPALLPAGLGDLRRTDAVGHLGRLEDADPRRHPADRRHHRAGGRALLLLADLHQQEARVVALTLDGIGARYGRATIFADITTGPIEGGALTAVIGPQRRRQNRRCSSASPAS